MAGDHLQHVGALLPVRPDEAQQQLGSRFALLGWLCVPARVHRVLVGRVLAVGLVERVDSLAD